MRTGAHYLNYLGDRSVEINDFLSSLNRTQAAGLEFQETLKSLIVEMSSDSVFDPLIAGSDRYRDGDIPLWVGGPRENELHNQRYKTILEVKRIQTCGQMPDGFFAIYPSWRSEFGLTLDDQGGSRADYVVVEELPAAEYHILKTEDVRRLHVRHLEQTRVWPPLWPAPEFGPSLWPSEAIGISHIMEIRNKPSCRTFEIVDLVQVIIDIVRTRTPFRTRLPGNIGGAVLHLTS